MPTVELFDTGDATRDDSRFGRELLPERGTDVHAQLAVLGLLADAVGHPAALHVRGHEIDPGIGRHFGRVGFEAEGVAPAYWKFADEFEHTEYGVQ